MMRIFLLVGLQVYWGSCLSVQLKRHEDRQAPAAKRFAYVTMVFDPSLLTPEETKLVVQPQDVDRWTMRKYLKGHPDLKDERWKSLKRDSLEHSELRHQLEHLEMLELDKSEATPGEAAEHARIKNFDKAIWRAAELRHQGSTIPLVVMHNLPDDAVNQTTMSRFNIIPLKMDASNFFTNRTCVAAQGYAEALQKILVFGLTDYDKMMWIDLDTQVRRNPDRHFQTELNGGLLGLRSDMWCDFTPNFTQPLGVKFQGEHGRPHDQWFRERLWHDVATSIFLFEPNKADLQGMIDLANEISFCLTDGNLIVHNFFRKSPDKVMFIPSDLALWARCTTQGFETDIVHKQFGLSWQGGGASAHARYPKGWVNPAAFEKTW